MGFKSFFKSAWVTFKLARKPNRKEFLLALRITLIGVALIGAITFIIRFVAIAIQGA
ncbi:MAG: protein translocase SEC61 complex subunit gamma [Thaumarchaeota archaeon]|nr:MAG: protein translocase SEC61 complex subunit gamma [Nitrososphaerota archaeon]